MAILRHFDIRRLKPFHREGDRMPKPAPEKADQLSDLDPDLRPDEQAYISHYLGYADVLLNASDEEMGANGQSTRTNVIELPHIEEPEQPDSNGNDKVA